MFGWRGNLIVTELNLGMMSRLNAVLFVPECDQWFYMSIYSEPRNLNQIQSNLANVHTDRIPVIPKQWIRGDPEQILVIVWPIFLSFLWWWWSDMDAGGDGEDLEFLVLAAGHRGHLCVRS